MKTNFLICSLLLLSILASAQSSDSSKTVRRAKVGGILQKVGSGLSAVGQKVVGGAAQVTGTLLQNGVSVGQPKSGRQASGNKKRCILGNCQNGKGAMWYPLSETTYVVFYATFINGQPDGWAHCLGEKPRSVGSFDMVAVSDQEPSPSNTPLWLEFKSGQRTGRAQIIQFVGTAKDGVGNVYKYGRYTYYEGPVNNDLRPHGVGKYYFDTAYYGRPKIPLIYADSLVVEEGVWKYAKQINQYNLSTHKIESALLDVTYMPYYPNHEQYKAKPVDNDRLLSNLNLPHKGTKVLYFPDGKIRQKSTFIDDGSNYSNRVKYQTTTLYDRDGKVVYEGKADPASLLATKGQCLSGNCQTGEGTYRWAASIADNYGTHNTSPTPAILVTKGRFQNGLPIGQHRVTTSQGSEFVGQLTPQFGFKWGTIRQDNGSYQGSFTTNNNESNGGIWIMTGVPVSHVFHTVAGTSIAVIKSSGSAIGVPSVNERIARQFTRDMHLGTVDANYTQLETPVKLTLTDSSVNIDQVKLRYRILWGAQNSLQTDVAVTSQYDPIREDIFFEYTITSENEGAKTWRQKAQAFETNELSKIGIKANERSGRLTVKQGKHTLWSSDVTTDTETRDEWSGYDYKGNAVYEQVKSERSDRFIDTYKLPVTYYCDNQPIGTITYLIFSETPNVLSSGSVMSWAGSKLLLGMGGLRENTVFAGQYGYVNLQEAITGMSHKVQRQGCKVKK